VRVLVCRLGWGGFPSNVARFGVKIVELGVDIGAVVCLIHRCRSWAVFASSSIRCHVVGFVDHERGASGCGCAI